MRNSYKYFSLTSEAQAGWLHRMPQPRSICRVRNLWESLDDGRTPNAAAELESWKKVRRVGSRTSEFGTPRYAISGWRVQLSTGTQAWEPTISIPGADWSSMKFCRSGRHNEEGGRHSNNNNTIWGGSVLTGEEPPPHSGELKHALTQAGGPTQSQLSRPMSSGHHISMEHRLRRKQLNSDTNASNKKYLKEIQEKRKEETFSSEKMKKKMKNIKKSKNEEMNKKMRKNEK